jgi:hypothetical protein
VLDRDQGLSRSRTKWIDARVPIASALADACICLASSSLEIMHCVDLSNPAL